MFCLDASVIISAARGTEIYSEKCQRFLERVCDEKLPVYLPEILISEIASGLIRATKNEVFSLKFVRILRAIPNFYFVPVDDRLSTS